MGASDVGLAASSDQVTLTYGHLGASANNDCPAADAPAGVVALTLSGVQTDGTGLITLCVPRPDLLGTMSLALGSDIKIVDLTGDSTTPAACSYMFDPTDTTRIPSGTASSSGLCSNGTDRKGFELDVNGGLALRRTCGITVDSIVVTLRGTIAVAGP